MIVTGSAMRRSLTLAAALLALACTRDLPTESSDVEVRAAKGGSSGGSTKTTTGPAVAAASPGAATRDTTLDVRILGSGFARGMVAQWAIDSVVTGKVVVNSTRFVSSTELVANITVTSDAPLTEYDIVVTSTKGGKPGIGTEVFEVVQELGLVSLGGDFSAASDINDSGQIAGYSSYYVPGGRGADRPVVWEKNGTIRDLLPAGFTMGRAVSINENGQVAGWLAGGSSGGFTLFVWSALTGMRFLPTLPGEDQNGVYAINDAGMVAGWSGRSAVIWENGILRVVHHDPAQWSAATDINNLGEVVGYYEPVLNGTPHTAWRWSAASGFQLLPTLQGNTGTPIGINDRGQIVGTSPSASGGGAFIHENGATRQLPAGSVGAFNAYAISEAGHVVGSAVDGRGVMWQPDGTLMLICTPVAPANGYSSSCAAGSVNSEGVAAGWKTDKYGFASQAYKWSEAGFF